MRTFLYIAVSALTGCVAFGQAGSASPHFEAADIHPSPLIGPQFVRGPFMSGARYDLRGATLVDLIVRAYDVTADKVLEGPNWVEYDRFDIGALMPPQTSAADSKLMLQALLADRFHLAFKKEERPLSAYVLTAPKGKQKLKEADGSGDTGCRLSLDQARPPEPGGTPSALAISFACHNMTMAAFAQQMTTMPLAQQFIGPNPVQDKTGLEGKWEFNFKYTLPGSASSGDAITLPDAIDKQLGLKLEQQTMSLAVIVVEKADRATANEPDVAKKIPAFPTEFEVATIKPFATPTPGSGPIAFGLRMQPSGRVEISGMTIKQLMQQAWGIQADSIVNAPKWMDTDRYSIVAKVPSNGPVYAPNTPIDTDTVFAMVRTLLADRFKLAVHFEDRPMTAYTLTAPKPKLKKADPASRTKWINANSGPILLNAASAPSTTLKFQNMSMAQLAEKLSAFAGTYIHSPVIDATGLEGGYDFTLTFSPIAPAMLANLSRPPAADPTGAAADPIGGVTIFEAVDKQLGLKLVEQKRPVRVLVIDHIDDKPDDN